MRRTTPKPRIDILTILPELADLSATTVRLHPRRGEVEELDASKMGGDFLWPADEPWPECDMVGPPKWWDRAWGVYPQGRHGPLIPVLQLRADEFPEIEFYPGTDLLQVLWCPMSHDSPTVARPFVFWRAFHEVLEPLLEIPEQEYADNDYVPFPCRLFPERVVEYPHIEMLSAELHEKLDAWDSDEVRALLDHVLDSPATLYECELSVCPGNKVGGFPCWVQSTEIPRCECDQQMDHLMTFTDHEFDASSYLRWLPEEEAEIWGTFYDKGGVIQNSMRLDGLGGGHLFLFICRRCNGWPVQSVYQR